MLVLHIFLQKIVPSCYLIFFVCRVCKIKKLVPISKFCTTNNTKVEFSPNGFVMKDLEMGSILLQEPNKGGIYECPSFENSSTSPLFAFSSVKTSY